MDKKRNFVLASCSLAVVVLALISCPSAVSRGGPGVITVSLGASSRGILDAPPVPKFSSAQVTVSGPGMSPVSANFVNNVATLEVPGGTDRVVTVDAVPDWAATAAAYPSSVLPRTALRYGGSATVDVKAGDTVKVAIKLHMTASKIVLPSGLNSLLYLVDSFEAVASASNSVSFPVGGSSDFVPDQYGRVYMSTSYAESGEYPAGYTAVYRNDGGDLSTSPIPIIETPAVPILRMAVDGLNGRLYTAGVYASTNDTSFGYYDGSSLFFVEIDQPSNLSGNWELYDESSFLSPCVAVDLEGNVYVNVYNVDEGMSYIAKISIGSPYYSSSDSKYMASSRLLAKIPYTSIGLTDDSGAPLSVGDMMVIDDRIYVLAVDMYSLFYYGTERGKIVSLATANLAGQQEAGWSPGPTPTDPASQLYGPTSFIGIGPGKLYISDEGGYNDIDRVVEIVTSPLAINRVSSVPSDVKFFSYAY